MPAEEMRHSEIVLLLLYLLWLSNGLSSDKSSTLEIIRDYQSSPEDLGQKCITKCSVSSVMQAILLWFNGSVIYSSLMITDLNTQLYLVLDYQDKNNYSCVVSSLGVNQTLHLNNSHVCQPCREVNLTMILVSEGESVILLTNLTEVQDKDCILWLYEGKDEIAILFNNKTTVCDICGFSKLQLDSKTGSLTIKNISKNHSGLYKLRITNGVQSTCGIKNYYVTVCDRLPVPVITNDSTRCSSSSKCVVLCSVNVTHVSLSWYNGSRVHSSISVSDPNTNFLCLGVENEDKNNYSCVVNNSFTNKTTQLNISELCKDHSKTDIGIIIGPIFGGLGVVGVVVLIWKCCCQNDASAGQPVVSYNVAQAGASNTSPETVEIKQTSEEENAGASGQATSGNNVNEETRLLP